MVETVESNDTELPVFLRLKPKPSYAGDEQPYLKVIPGTPSIKIDPPKGSRYKSEDVFHFSGIFREPSTQLDVYKSAVFPLVQSTLTDGEDSIFFTMGASGSGKSHTVLGYRKTPGMVHMAVDTLFKSIGPNIAEFDFVESISDKNPHRSSSAVEAGIYLDWKSDSPKVYYLPHSLYAEKTEIDPKYNYGVYISMVEIYNDRIFSLLDDSTKRRPLNLKTDSNGKVILSDMQKIFVSEKAEAYRVIEQGLSARKANATGMNESSSRSHAFINIEVKKIPKDRRSKKVHSSTLTIVDLAGSERNKMANTAGMGLAESCAINKSLMLLGQCLQRQRDREKGRDSGLKGDFSIFRNSKLTHLLLSNVFNANFTTKALLLVNVDPYTDFSTASQILRYSALAKDIEIPKRVSNGSQGADSSATLVELDWPSDNDRENNANELIQRIIALEQALQEANERCLQVEEEVREELSNETEERIAMIEQKYLDQLDEDYERNKQLMDQKIELLAQTGLDMKQDVQYLTEQNERLAKENKQLKHQLSNTHE
ncbi:hypothetical protein TRVA0_022S01574 [Trichomonascus vanleenenianus]|uniref:uncharacterized protein n=1 Tax=Trichomonascus vanleenenianus TaxID=2268995 RepID=UPI003ECAFDC5